MAGENGRIQVDVVVNSRDAEGQIRTLKKEINDTKAAIEKASRVEGTFINIDGIKKNVSQAIAHLDTLQNKLKEVESNYGSNKSKVNDTWLTSQIKQMEAEEKQLSALEERRKKVLSNPNWYNGETKGNQLEFSGKPTYDTTKSAKESAEYFRQQLVAQDNITKAKERTAVAEQKANDTTRKSARESADAINKIYKEQDEVQSARESSALKRWDAYYNHQVKSARESAKEFERFFGGDQTEFKGKSSYEAPGKSASDSAYAFKQLMSQDSFMSYQQQLSNLNKLAEKHWQAWKLTGDEVNKVKFDGVSTAIGNVKGQMDSFAKSAVGAGNAWTDMKARIDSHASWIMAGAAISVALASPVMLVEKLSELEQQFNQLKTVIPEIHDDQTKYNQSMNDAFGLAEKYGSKIKEVTESMRLMGRGYHELSTTEKLAENALKLSVADNFSPEVATRALEAVIGGYNEQSNAVQFSARVMDSMTRVSHTAQVSANDLAEALMRSAAAAHTVGVGFDELTAMTATIARNTGLSGQTIGDGLKSMLNSIHTTKAIKELEAFGVEVYKVGEDGTKEFRNISDVLLDVSTKSEKANVNIERLFKQLSGGKFQVTKMAALLGDPDEYIRVLGSSINSSGFTDKQIGIQMDTIARKAETLKASFEQLINSMGNQSGFANSIKSIIDGLNQLIKGLNQISPASWAAAGSITQIATVALITKEVVTLLGKSMVSFATATREATVAQATLDAVVSKTPWGAVAKLAVVAASALGVWAYAEGALAKTQEDRAQSYDNNLKAEQTQVEMHERQIPLLETLGNRYQQLQEQEATATVGSEDYQKIKEKEASIHKTLSETVGQEAADQIICSDNINEAIKQEQAVLHDVIKQKKQELFDMRVARDGDIDAEIYHTNQCAEAYATDLKNFGDTIAGKIALIGVLRAAQVTAMEWEDKGFEVQRDWYAKLAAAAPEGSDRRAQYETQVANLDSTLENNRAYAAKLMESPLEGYRAKAEELKSQKMQNLSRLTQEGGGGTRSDTGKVEEDDDNKTPKTPNGTSGSPTGNANRVTRDERKMAQEQMFYDAKKSAESYDKTLSDLTNRESIYGKTVESTYATLEMKRKRSLELADEASKYDNEQQYLMNEIDTTIGKTPELLETIGETQEEWCGKTKEEREEVRGVNKELLTQNGLIKSTFELALKYGDAAIKARKESVGLAHDVKKSMIGDSLDETKVLPNKLDEINTNQGLEMTDVDQYKPLREEKENAIKLKYQQQTTAAYKAEEDRLKQQANQAQVVDKAVHELNKQSEENLETQIEWLNTAEQTPTVIDAVAVATKKLADLRKEDTKATDDNMRAQKKAQLNTATSEQKEIELKRENINKVKKWEADSLIDMAQNGKSFKDVMKDLWNGIAKDAIYAMLRVKGQSSSIGTTIIGAIGGKGSKTSGSTGKSGVGGKKANGGVVNVPSIAGEDGEEVVIPVEKNKSNSPALLSYASKKLGVSAGGSEYVPYFKNQKLASQPMVNVNVQQGETIKQLQEANSLMRQQNNLLLNSSSNNSSPTIVTTAVSSEQVLQVLQQNPQALQNILGRNKSNGWR